MSNLTTSFFTNPSVYITMRSWIALQFHQNHQIHIHQNTQSISMYTIYYRSFNHRSLLNLTLSLKNGKKRKQKKLTLNWLKYRGENRQGKQNFGMSIIHFRTTLSSDKATDMVPCWGKRLHLIFCQKEFTKRLKT